MPRNTARIEPTRWSLWQASQELGKTINKITAGVKQHGIKPGPDEKYSPKDIFMALSDQSGLEAKAKRAKFEQIITDAENSRSLRDERRKTLVPVTKLKEFAADKLTQLVQFIKHSKLIPDKDKKQLLTMIREWRFEP